MAEGHDAKRGNVFLKNAQPVTQPTACCKEKARPTFAKYPYGREAGSVDGFKYSKGDVGIRCDLGCGQPACIFGQAQGIYAQDENVLSRSEKGHRFRQSNCLSIGSLMREERVIKDYRNIRMSEVRRWRKARIMGSARPSACSQMAAIRGLDDFRANLGISLCYGLGAVIGGLVGFWRHSHTYRSGVAEFLPLCAGAMMLWPVMTVGLDKIAGGRGRNTMAQRQDNFFWPRSL